MREFIFEISKCSISMLKEKQLLAQLVWEVERLKPFLCLQPPESCAVLNWSSVKWSPYYYTYFLLILIMFFSRFMFLSPCSSETFIFHFSHTCSNSPQQAGDYDTWAASRAALSVPADLVGLCNQIRRGLTAQVRLKVWSTKVQRDKVSKDT